MFGCIVYGMDQDQEPTSNATLVAFIIVVFVVLCLLVGWFIRIFASAGPGESF